MFPEKEGGACRRIRQTVARTTTVNAQKERNRLGCKFCKEEIENEIKHSQGTKVNNVSLTRRAMGGTVQ